MQHDERPYAAPAGAHDARTLQPMAASGPGEAEAPVIGREAVVSEWEDTAMDAPCL